MPDEPRRLNVSEVEITDVLRHHFAREYQRPRDQVAVHRREDRHGEPMWAVEILGLGPPMAKAHADQEATRCFECNTPKLGRCPKHGG